MKKRNVYVAFSGGGAKAIIHTGALSYIEQMHRIVGVSGTSAGAMIAALSAAGFRADEIFNPEKNGESKVFDRIKGRRKNTKYLGDLIGGGGVRDLRRAHGNFLMFCIGKLGVWKSLLMLCSVLLFSVISVLVHDALFEYVGPVLSGIFSAVLLTALIFLSFIFYFIPCVIRLANKVICDGIADSEVAITEICEEIASKLRITGREVAMGDFNIPLYIVATDITNKRAAVFSNSETPDVMLRDALSASICIPGAFKVHEVEGVKFIDGGIVSNLPAFVFNDNLSLYPDRRVVALRIVEDYSGDPPRKACRLWSFLPSYKSIMATSLQIGSDVIKTVFTGTQDLAHANMRIVQASLPTPLRMLDFNLTVEDALTAHNQGQVAAKKLILQAFAAEDAYNDACKAIASQVRQELINLALAARRSGATVRVAMAFRASEGSGIINIPYSYGFADKADWNMSIPMDNTVCGEAWRAQRPIFVYGSKKIFKGLAKFPHIQSRLDKNIQWILSVPIIDPDSDRTAFVINIDSNTKVREYLELGQDEVDNFSAALTRIARSASFIGNATRDAINEFQVESWHD